MKSDERDELAILVVDDIDENLVAMRALLQQDGLTIHEARSGTEALEILLVHDVALAIVDVQMPGMDGFELATLMRGSARTQKVPIIFVTASSSGRKSLFEGYEAGAVDYLFKPIDGHVLKSKCAVFLELYQQRRAIEAQLRTNELVVAAVGHDLRNPLNAMLMGLHLLREGSDLAERERRVLDRVHSSGMRMVRLIDDLYDVARVRLGSGIDLELKDNVDLVALVRQVVLEAQTAGAKQKIELAEQGACVGRFDPDRLARVFSNLLGNAVRYGKHDEPIRISLCCEGDYAVVRVTNGGTIARDVLPSLWDPFKRSSATAGKEPKGLGLGLYIVRAIVSAHRGVASAQSSEDSTTFEVKLPKRLLS